MTAAPETAVDQAFWLARLRGAFPHTGFLFDGRRWVAVRGRRWTLVAATAIELYDRLAALRTPSHPSE